GVLPFLHASSAWLRGGGGKPRRVSRRDGISADPPESPSLSAVLRAADSALSLVRRLESVLAWRIVRPFRRNSRPRGECHAALALHILLPFTPPPGGRSGRLLLGQCGLPRAASGVGAAVVAE